MNRLILLVTMVAGLTIAGCSKSGWQDFNSAEGKYSVQFPGKPEDESVTYRPGPQVHAHMVKLPKATFLVAFIDLPPGIQLDYREAIQGMTWLVGGRVTTERDWTIDGNTGKEIEMSITDTPFFPVGWVAIAGNKGKQVELPVNKMKAGFASSRMVVINNRLYQIVVIGETATFDDPDVKRFFDSFKLNQ